MTEIVAATKDHSRSVRKRAPDHLVPILDAVIDYGCAHFTGAGQGWQDRPPAVRQADHLRHWR